MSERLENILKLISQSTMIPVKGFERISDDTFVIKTLYSDWGHRTQLSYDASDESITVELTHIFGYLDIDGAANINDLLRPLIMNSASINNYGVFLAGEPDDNRLLLSLRDSQEFLLKWSDEDIAQLLINKVLSIGAAFVFGMPEPIKIFNPQ